MNRVKEDEKGAETKGWSEVTRLLPWYLILWLQIGLLPRRQTSKGNYFIPIRPYPPLPQIILKDSVRKKKRRIKTLMKNTQCKLLEMTLSECVKKSQTKPPQCHFTHNADRAQPALLVFRVIPGLCDSTSLPVENGLSMQSTRESVLTSSMERFAFFFFFFFFYLLHLPPVTFKYCQ